MPVSVSVEKIRPGAAAVPAVILSWPVMAAWPSRGRLFVTSDAKSVKLAFISEDEIVVPLENELDTDIVPDPLRGICHSLLGAYGPACHTSLAHRDAGRDVPKSINELVVAAK